MVRLSRGAGLPAPLPDVLGLAVRFGGLGTDGGPLDVLVDTSGACPDDDDAERLRFRPTLGAGDLQPVGPFRAVRHRSYRQSQALRRWIARRTQERERTPVLSLLNV